MKRWHYVVSCITLLIVSTLTYVLGGVQGGLTYGSLVSIALLILTLVYGSRVEINPRWLVVVAALLNMMLPIMALFVFIFMVTRKPRKASTEVQINKSLY